ncbi:MAG: DnaJ domain-containing protein [Alphaproteobacteria bacterium]|nr:DnaJ domain-containing protein [Alphaproteobacteria bacterium]MCL2505060.1 DnaJ domain-containing protein [Alphaproteobacteria bacterium]
MAVVIGISGFIDNGENKHCWMCQKPVHVHVIFCHICGSIQQVHKIDCFARLNLDKNLDIDLELLEKNYHALTKVLNPERFMIRGINERKYAAQHFEVLQEAYHILKDPLKRGKYWLSLHEKILDDEEYQELPIVEEIKTELEQAEKPAECDLVARKVCQTLAQAIGVFMQALRGSAWRNANATLRHISSLEEVLNSVRAKRIGLK